jgi:hypothetical protein
MPAKVRVPESFKKKQARDSELKSKAEAAAKQAEKVACF